MTSRSNQYELLLQEVLRNGETRKDRTGVGTLSVFKRNMRFDISESFPLITTKEIHFKSVALELLWFLRGDSNVRWLQERGVRIWDEWADENGELGPIYGVQWRKWQAPDGRRIDQIANLIDGLKNDPYSRRHVVSAWNPADIDEMKLPPCHLEFQFYVTGDGKLSCDLTQRSADMFLGVPFNIASYSLLTYMVAQQVGLKPGEFTWSGRDCHIYLNHIPQVKEQLHGRYPLPYPQLKILRKPKDIFSYKLEDFEVIGYTPYPAIKAPVAV